MYFLNNLFFFLIFKTISFKNLYTNKKKLFFYRNDFKVFKKYTPIIQNQIYFNSGIKKNLTLIENLFKFKINFLILDKNYNYNYLPVCNPTKLKKNQLIGKIFKYFDIRVLFFLNLKKKTIKKFFDFRLINITPTRKNSFKHTEINFNFICCDIYGYIMYTHTLNIYKKNL